MGAESGPLRGPCSAFRVPALSDDRRVPREHAGVWKAAATPAISAARAAGIDHRVHHYEHDSSSEHHGQEAAARLEVDPARVFKTLVMTVDDTLTIALVPVDRQLDLKQLALASGGKRASMAPPREAERASGYPLGAISPLGQKKPRPTVMDASAVGHETIFVSAGRRGLELELTPQNLIRLTNATTADLAR